MLNLARLFTCTAQPLTFKLLIPLSSILTSNIPTTHPDACSHRPPPTISARLCIASQETHGASILNNNSPCNSKSMAAIVLFTRLLSRLFRRVPYQQEFSDASLLGLSTELLQKIAEKLELKDIQALRLTSKTANDKTLYIFANSFFANRIVHITNLASLQRGVDVANQTKAIQAKGEDVKLLKELFAALGVANRVEKITMTDINKNNPDALQQEGSPSTHCPRPFHIIMEALYDSDLRPKVFEFAGKKWNVPIYSLAPLSFLHAAGR